MNHTQIRNPKSEIRNLKCAFWFALAVAGAAWRVPAQVGGAVNQMDNSNSREQLNQAAESRLSESNSVPQLYEGETSDVGPQSVVTTRERQTLFQARVDEQLLYTDNAFLTANNKINTGVLISSAQFALAPTPYALGDATLAPRIGYEGKWFDYFFNGQQVRFIGDEELPRGERLDDFDFTAQSVFGDATWTRGHLSLGGGLEATRMFFTAHYDPFYNELSPYWSARYVVPLCDKAALSASYIGDYRFTSVAPDYFSGALRSDANDRMDQGLLLAWTQVLNKHLVFQPFYQFKYTRYADELSAFDPETDQVIMSRNEDPDTALGLYWLVCPNGPGDLVSPRSPFSPAGPCSPRAPGSPGAPGSPRSPGTPTSPF